MSVVFTVILVVALVIYIPNWSALPAKALHQCPLRNDIGQQLTGDGN